MSFGYGITRFPLETRRAEQVITRNKTGRDGHKQKQDGERRRQSHRRGTQGYRPETQQPNATRKRKNQTHVPTGGVQGRKTQEPNLRANRGSPGKKTREPNVRGNRGRTRRKNTRLRGTPAGEERRGNKGKPQTTVTNRGGREERVRKRGTPGGGWREGEHDEHRQGGEKLYFY